MLSLCNLCTFLHLHSCTVRLSERKIVFLKLLSFFQCFVNMLVLCKPVFLHSWLSEGKIVFLRFLSFFQGFITPAMGDHQVSVLCERAYIVQWKIHLHVVFFHTSKLFQGFRHSTIVLGLLCVYVNLAFYLVKCLQVFTQVSVVSGASAICSQLAIGFLHYIMGDNCIAIATTTLKGIQYCTLRGEIKATFYMQLLM